MNSNSPLVAHAGFLNGAAALFSEVTRRVEQVAAEDKGPRHILLTGHSAGGAVASLIFAKFLAEAKCPCKLIFLLLDSCSSAHTESFQTQIKLANLLFRLRPYSSVFLDNFRRSTHHIAVSYTTSLFPSHLSIISWPRPSVCQCI